MLLCWGISSSTKTTKKLCLAQVQFNNKFPNPNTQKIYNKFPNQLRKKKIKNQSLTNQDPSKWKTKKHRNIKKYSLMQYLPFICSALIQSSVNDQRPPLSFSLCCSSFSLGLPRSLYFSFWSFSLSPLWWSNSLEVLKLFWPRGVETWKKTKWRSVWRKIEIREK